MQRMNPRKINLSVLVIGDESAEPTSLIDKFMGASDLEAALPETKKLMRSIRFDIHRVEMDFKALSANVDDECIVNSDVILFCYNTHEKASYDAMLACLNRICIGYKGIVALVGFSHDLAHPNSDIVKLSGNLGAMLSSVYPSTYLGLYISRHRDPHCGVGQIILNFIADKALKLSPVNMPVSQAPEPKLLPVKPSVAMSALVLGATGVGKRSVFNQIMSLGAAYRDNAHGAFHVSVDVPANNIDLQLASTDKANKVDAKNYRFAILCFDLTNPKSIEILLDEIKLLVQANNKIFFALLGNKRDLFTADHCRSSIIDDMNSRIQIFTQILAEMYSYHFMGVYLNSTQNKRYNQAPLLINILCEKYGTTLEEEKSLVSTFREKHRSVKNSEIFSRTTVPEEVSDEDEVDLDFHIHNASRTDIEAPRSRGIFKNLGWFGENGKLCKTTPELIEQRRQALDLSGADYSQKLIKPSKTRQG